MTSIRLWLLLKTCGAGLEDSSSFWGYFGNCSIFGASKIYECGLPPSDDIFWRSLPSNSSESVLLCTFGY